MFLDNESNLSSSQAVTTSAVGTNVIDLGVARAMGNGEPIAVMFTVQVDADQTTGDETYAFDVEVATDAAQTTGVQLMGRRIFESGTPSAPNQNSDLLVAGFTFSIVIPPAEVAESARYLGIRYVTGGTSPTITMDANVIPLSMVNQDNDYASGYSIT